MYQEKQRDMKKSDIINEYNSLTSTVNSLLMDYLRLTGKNWEGTPRTGNMSPSCMNDYKDNLERRLNGRKCTIISIREAIDTWKRTEDLKSTEEGRNFINGYKETKEVLEKRIENIGKKLSQSFELCLAAVGMEDWKVSGKEGIVPERSYVYFDIEKKGIDARLAIVVDLQNNRGMEVSSSLHCSGGKSIADFDENYWQFKGYTLIHENHEIFNNWMNKEYRVANIEVRDIRDRIEKIEKVLADPMSEYIVKKIEN